MACRVCGDTEVGAGAPCPRCVMGCDCRGGTPLGSLVILAAGAGLFFAGDLAGLGLLLVTLGAVKLGLGLWLRRTAS